MMDPEVLLTCLELLLISKLALDDASGSGYALGHPRTYEVEFLHYYFAFH